MVRHRALWALALVAWAAAAWAQDVPGDPDEPAQQGEITPADEVVVVSASRQEERRINAPVTMTVIPESVTGGAPSRSLTDLLRVVPGLNVVQTSARDVNVTSRASTGTLADSTLVLLDGRSIYQDFFGFVMWDLLPVDTTEIKQVEVIRGPASAVWGTNAMTGVINVISKTPRELEGTTTSIRFGQFNRAGSGEDYDGGGLFAVNAIHAAAPDDRFAYKLSAGFLTQEPFPRSTDTASGRDFVNRGTSQHRFDARVDYDFPDRRRALVIAGGLAATEGILHSGLGPLHVQRGSMLKYGRVTYSRDRLKVQLFVNDLDGEAPFLLQNGADGEPIRSTIENQSYDVEFSNQHLLNRRHLLSYGGSFRHNAFDISIAPNGHRRDEGGAWMQDQMAFRADSLLWTIGARVDRIGILDRTVASPRTALIVRPRPGQSVRLSFNQAFRAPSFISNFFDTAFEAQANLGPAGAFRFPFSAVGSTELREEKLTAYEIGYLALVGEVTFDAAFYLNRTRDTVLFTRTAAYTSANPPPGWPLPPAVVDDLAASGSALPSQYSYRNFDQLTERGVELSVEARLTPRTTAFANYTWQDDPVPRGFDVAELNLPPTHTVHAGLAYDGPRYFGSVRGSFQSEAFWQGVLDPGYTEPYTLVDAAVGLHSADGSITAAIRVTNLLNDGDRQHVFGDLIRRTLTGELRVALR
jgi:iron complex outermembrane receptor protein